MREMEEKLDETKERGEQRGVMIKAISQRFVDFSRCGTRSGFLESFDDPFREQSWSRKT